MRDESKSSNSYHSNYDEELYVIAVNEIDSRQYSKTLWTKALAKSEFDESKAKSVYVELRVDQLKSNLEHDKAAAEAAVEAAVESEQKSRSIVDNVTGSPLFLIQALLVAAVVGVNDQSWWVFGIVAFVLIILMTFPQTSGFIAVVLAGLFGLSGYVLANEFGGQTSGYWIGGITFLFLLSVNLKIHKKNKEIGWGSEEDKAIRRSISEINKNIRMREREQARIERDGIKLEKSIDKRLKELGIDEQPEEDKRLKELEGLKTQEELEEALHKRLNELKEQEEKKLT